MVVSAQRPASDPDSDGPRNLLDAVRVAINPDAVGKGVVVVMNGQINAARDVTTNEYQSSRDIPELGVWSTGSRG
ncbi:MAG: asparaginase domain-containing protein [Bryobacteraceae bacterium]